MRIFGFAGWILLLTIFPSLVFAAKDVAKPRVLVVFSYEKDFSWDIEVREGLESVFGDRAELNYFYMDTKIALKSGPQKAEEAYALYRRLQPDGVIVSDDNAQSMFVVPYLRNRVETPVVFCGVNADPQKYGYPADNVTGILERQPISEAIALVQQLVPSIKRVGFIMKASPTAQAIVEEIKADNDKYSAKFVDFKLPTSLPEALTMAAELSKTTDALYLVNFSGLLDSTGKQLRDEQIIPQLSEAYGKPLFSGSSYNVRFDGVLAAVAKTGQEQGSVAAKMLTRLLAGEAIDAVPISRNYRGKRIINVTTLRKLNINPSPLVLRGVELVRSDGDIRVVE